VTGVQTCARPILTVTSPKRQPSGVFTGTSEH
jgi:hypothetical protein